MNFNTAKLVCDIETAAIADAGQYLTEPINAPANWKDPIKIADHIAEKRAEQLDRAGLDPDLLRIVAIGWMLEGRDADPVVRVCQDERLERLALEEFWREVTGIPGGVTRRLVTFNGFAFDLPILMRRSFYLQTSYQHLSVDKYRSQHVDLFQKLSFNGAIKAHSLAFYGKRLGLPVQHPELDGSMMPQLVAAGQWDAIGQHCASDVQLTHDLAVRMGLIAFNEDAATELAEAEVF